MSRIYQDPLEMVREVERDLWEMGISVHPQTMQDKYVGDDANYKTKEVRGYSFSIAGWKFNYDSIEALVQYVLKNALTTREVMDYIFQEFQDRIGPAANPGNSFEHRKGIWDEFMHDGKFAYTYSERMAPQLERIIYELTTCPETRQGIINIHSNIAAENEIFAGCHKVSLGADAINMGGVSRIPCSMYYQVMLREGKLDLIYTMRSCDFLVHFPVDIALALMLQDHIATQLNVPVGTFTYFTGSLHAYNKDMGERGIF